MLLVLESCFVPGMGLELCEKIRTTLTWQVRSFTLFHDSVIVISTMFSSRIMSSKDSEYMRRLRYWWARCRERNRKVICSLRAISMRKVKNVDSGYRLFGGGGCNGVSQMVVITRYIGVVHTERDEGH